MSKPTIKISLRDEQYDELWLYADRKGMTPSAFVKMAAFYYMRKYTGKPRVKLNVPSKVPPDENGVKPHKV